MIPDGYQIREYEAGDLGRLAEIEYLASQLFAEFGFPTLARKEQVSNETLQSFLNESEVWVAATSDHLPVGYAVANDLDGVFYLRELSVDPEHGQKGIGTALLKAVIERAKWANYAVVAISTLKSVPFNAPFYSRHGFMEVDPNSVGKAIYNQFIDEMPENKLPSTRTVMLKRI